jgi:Leucine-rich repeat (LRR) protein
MSKLKEVLLNGNNFLSVPESLISVASSLQFLHISENPIEVIDHESFKGLERLEFVNISGMSLLTEIKENSFKHLLSLETLICRGNKKFDTFEMEDLRDLKHLKQLDVSHNLLTTLEFGEIGNHHESQFEQLRTLKLAGNPWICDCKMMRSLTVFNHSAKYFKKSSNNDAARCGKPFDLTSKLLYDLPLDYVCASHEKQKDPRIKIYEPPQFLRPKSIMLTVFSVVGVVILGIIIGFVIVCIKRKLKPNDASYSSSPIRYTTVRNSTSNAT